LLNTTTVYSKQQTKEKIMNAESRSQAVVAREPVSSEILSFSTVLAEMAQRIAIETERKLDPVVRRPTPMADGNQKEPQREYPPFFEAMRERFLTIKQSLEAIEDSIERTEL
jgi:hypothetical protein